MSYATGRIAIGRKHETLAVIDTDVSVESLDGKFPAWQGGGGRVKVDFNANPGPAPHSGYGSITLDDGAGHPILSLPNVLIQIEEGAKEGPWRTLAQFVARGIDTEGREVAFQTEGPDPVDTESLVVNFALADTSSAADTKAVLAWSGILPVQDDILLPAWAQAWLTGAGVAVDAFAKFVHEAAKKVDAPQDLEAKIVNWITDNVAQKLNPSTVLAFAMLVVAELRSGRPGYRKDHGGLV